jgi:hypothetical protein
MTYTPGRYPKVKASNQAYYFRNKAAIAASRYAWAKARKALVFTAYGGLCACGVKAVRLEKLESLDPEAQKLKGGVLVKWIIDHEFPTGIWLRCNTCFKAATVRGPEKCRKWRDGRDAEQVALAHDSNLGCTARYRADHPDRILTLKRNRRAAKLSTGTVTTEEWEAIKEAAGQKCVACGREIRLSMDHIIPLALGGPHLLRNIQPLCHSCNSRKNIKTTDYRTPEMKQKLGITDPEDDDA